MGNNPVDPVTLDGNTVSGPEPEVIPDRSEPDSRGVGEPSAHAADSQARFLHYLPPGVRDRTGWANDYATAFRTLGIEASARNICAVLAVTEQESSFRPEPLVAGLGRIVRHEIDLRADRYHIPDWMLKTALSVRSPDGRSYAQRIDALQTENDLNRLYRDMTSELPLGHQLLEGYNPVRTGGPMQVSLKFAEDHTATHRYPYSYDGSLRDELFTRRGGVYFGVAYLLGYPVSYNQMLYRFADFNAGRYASRNAAFQKAVSTLTGTTMDYDGDLLRYEDDRVSGQSSQTLDALLTLAPRLKLGASAIQADLQHEKSAGFEKTPLFTRIFALARDKTGREWQAQTLPEIRLRSPKIRHGFTTAGFAQRVNTRYRQCLSRE